MNALGEKNQSIRENYERIRDRVNEAAVKAGRIAEDIRLVVVTKTQSIEHIQSAIEAGATDLGENYIEEALPKIEQFHSLTNLKWHMIGHLQRRKAQNFCHYFNFLHSLDSFKLARRINQVAEEENMKIPVWLEFNVGGEESKAGWNIADEAQWSALLPDIAEIFELHNLEVLGVMTVPPFSDDPELSRLNFQKLRKLQRFVLDQLDPANFKELSIGMSSDFEVAIQEGSTCVRIGQAIFGPRHG